MRYLVKAKLKENKAAGLKDAIENSTLGKGSVAGDEYLRDMKHARLFENGTICWIEVCFCSTPLAEEKPYWEEYFHLLEVSDAADRKTCKHESGEKPWSCINCTCTKDKMKELKSSGEKFTRIFNSNGDEDIPA
ncbi:MAG: hypothetical protein ACM3RX_03630 [Methanococcaceae archaeon]